VRKRRPFCFGGDLLPGLLPDGLDVEQQDQHDARPTPTTLAGHGERRDDDSTGAAAG